MEYNLYSIKHLNILAMKTQYLYIFTNPGNFNEIKNRFQNWKNAGFEKGRNEIGISYPQNESFDTVVNSIQYALAGFVPIDDYIICEF